VAIDRRSSSKVGFLQKPISPDTLSHKVRAALDSTDGESR
jgi:hypothetical protein